MKVNSLIYIIGIIIQLALGDLSAQPIMDGSFDGEAIWGTPIAIGTDNAEWAGAKAKKLYFTSCGDYAYFGAEVTASDWMNWVFIINNTPGGGTIESWSRSIDYNHTAAPDFILRGHFNSYAEYHSWDGSVWTGLGIATNQNDFGENIIGANQDGWVECRVLKSQLGNVSIGDIQFYITGNNNNHGTFDAIPDEQNATSWDHSTNHTILDNYQSGINFGNPIVDVSPSFPTSDQQITITFDASCTSLAGASNIYIHSGVSVTESAIFNFDYSIGNWGMDDGIGQMTSLGSDVWEFTISNINTYFNVDIEEDVFGLNFLFRNDDGSISVNNNGSNYHNAVDPGDYFTISSPSYDPFLVEINNAFDINSTSNTIPSTWTLYEIDPISDIILNTLTTQNNGLVFTYNMTLTDTNLKKYKLEIDYAGNIKYKTFKIIAHNSINEIERPSWTKVGINYHSDDPTKLTLVLHAPTFTTFKDGNGTTTGTNSTIAKEIVYIVGDFNNWTISESYKMNRDRDGWDGTTDSDNDGDHGDYWWIELTGLTPNQEYIFQYYMNDGIQIADPYSAKISDPDDQFIPSTTYPALVPYPAQAIDRASVFQTNQTAYTWTAVPFSKPSNDKLNIYELLFRDFTEEGTYLAAIAKLDYIKGLGINAIHVMPVSEFEGNSSWGYNPNFYFAADKAYGTDTDLKQFIDECHKREIQVFNDLVLNHAFYSNTNAKMYWNDTANKPANDNPWFNPDHKMIADQSGWWGADWNHESEHTQQMVDSILSYWLTEFNFDGFRFDFTKGFGQTAQDSNDPWAGSYDQSRIDLLKRMVNNMWLTKPGSVAIFEHLTNQPEEKILADYGILLWSGVGHHNQVKSFVLGWDGDDTDIYNTGVYNSAQNNFNFANLMSYPESHDEERLAYELSQYYNGPKTVENIINRMKLGMAFNMMLPGPRMLWQMEELGYDISIDFNGRTGEKPVKWDYFEDTKRRELYTLIQKIFKIRNKYNIYNTAPDYGNIGLPSGNITTPRKMSFSDGNGHHVIVIGNLDPNSSHSLFPNYDVIGNWYQYNGNIQIDGTSFVVNNTTDTYTLLPSAVMLLTNFKIDDCLDVVNTHNNGYGSLRSAIACANGGDTLRFDFTVWNDTISIQSPLILDKDINIITAGKNIVIDGSNSIETFNLQSSHQLYINGLELICGNGTTGRCINNAGTLILENTNIIDMSPSTEDAIINLNGTIQIEGNVNLKK